MKNIKRLLLFTIVFGFLSCSPTYYTPNTHNIPLISERGETILGLSGHGDRVEFHAAYGINDKIAVKINGGRFSLNELDGSGSGKFFD